jgi:hypothetical protein
VNEESWIRPTIYDDVHLIVHILQFVSDISHYVIDSVSCKICAAAIRASSCVNLVDKLTQEEARLWDGESG